MRTKKAFLNVLVGVSTLFFTTIFSFINSRIFVSNIGVEISGLNNVFLNVISIMSVTELGIAGAINFNLYKPVLENDYSKISRIMSFYKKCYLIIGVFILAFSLVFSNYVYMLVGDTTLSNSYVKLTFILCALATVFSYFLAYYRNLFYAFQDNFITLIVDSIIRVSTLIVQLIVLTKYKSYVLYLIINLLSNIIGNLIIALSAKKRYPYVKLSVKTKDKALEKKVLSDVKSLAIIQLASAAINFTDSLIISRFLGLVVAGIYAYYAQIINILSNTVNMIFNNLGASIGNLLAEKKEENVKSVFNILSYFCLFLGIFVSSGLINTIDGFMKFWLGDTFVIDYAIVFTLGINFYIFVQRQVVTYYLRTGGYHKDLVIPLIIEASLNLCISIILARNLGLLGVFLGTFISATYGFVQNSKMLFKKFGFNYYNYIIKEVLVFVFFIIQVLIMRKVILSLSLYSGSLADIILSGILSVFIPTIFIIIVFVKEPNLNYYFHSLKSRKVREQK